MAQDRKSQGARGKIPTLTASQGTLRCSRNGRTIFFQTYILQFFRFALLYAPRSLLHAPCVFSLCPLLYALLSLLLASLRRLLEQHSVHHLTEHVPNRDMDFLNAGDSGGIHHQSEIHDLRQVAAVSPG
jgi:hypothetical protein